MDMRSETNVVLKYRRTKMCWICTSCEIENDIVAKSCIMCGKPRAVDSVVENIWTPQDEYIMPNNIGARGYNPPPVYYKENNDNSGLAILIWAIVIIAIVVLLLTQI